MQCIIKVAHLVMDELCAVITHLEMNWMGLWISLNVV